MIAFLLKGIPALPYVGIALALAAAWNVAIENPGIRREARAGYVAEATVAALVASNEEIRRQAKVANDAVAAFAKRAEEAEAARVAADTAAEERIRAYEEQRVREGRTCPLSDADLDELRRAPDGSRRGGGTVGGRGDATGLPARLPEARPAHP